MKILLIEEDVQKLSTVRDMLELEDYQIVVATNGAEGLKRATTETPDYILCSLSLPDMTIWDVLNQLRDNDITLQIPFIVIPPRKQQADLYRSQQRQQLIDATRPFHHIFQALDDIRPVFREP